MKVLVTWLLTENGAIVESGASVVETYANVYSAPEAGAGFSILKADAAATVVIWDNQEFHVAGVLPLGE
jgi:hypothetical protein